MKEVPKFLLASNHAAAPEQTFLVHTQSPSFVAHVHRFSDPAEADSYLVATRPQHHFQRSNPAMLIEVIRFFEPTPDLRRIDWLLKRAATWYVMSGNIANPPD